MSPKTIVVLAVLAICMTIAAGASLTLDRGARLDPLIGTAVFPGLLDRANDVTEFTVESNLGKLSFDRSESGWTLRESDNYPVLTVKARGAILDIASLRFHEAKTKRPDKFAKLNLLDFDAAGSGSSRIILKSKDGSVLSDLIVGNSKFNLPGTTTGGVYVRLPGKNQAWLAQGGVGFTGVASDWLEPKVFNIAGHRIKRTEIFNPGNESVVITKRNEKTLVFTLQGVPLGYKIRYAEEPKLIATNLEAFELEDARAAKSVPFPHSGTKKTVFETFDGLQITAETTSHQGKFWSRFAFSAQPNSAAAAEAKELSERTKNWVYQIADYRAARFTKTMSELVAPNQ